MPVEIHFMLCFHLKHKVSGFKLPFVFCVGIFNGSGEASAHGKVLFAHHVKRRLHKAAAVFQNIRNAVAVLKGFQCLSASKFKVGVVQIFCHGGVIVFNHFGRKCFGTVLGVNVVLRPYKSSLFNRFNRFIISPVGKMFIKTERRIPVFQLVNLIQQDFFLYVKIRPLF